jgi:hypothetical protein
MGKICLVILIENKILHIFFLIFFFSNFLFKDFILKIIIVLDQVPS